MRQGQPVEDCLPGGLADVRAQVGIPEEDLQALHEFVEPVDWNQPAVGPVIDDFVDALAPTCDYGLATRHRFQINTSEAFVPAGQNKNRAVAHGFGHAGAASPPQKMNLTAYAQISGQSGETISVCTFADNAALQAGMRIL
jgi:hypothetical protein